MVAPISVRQCHAQIVGRVGLCLRKLHDLVVFEVQLADGLLVVQAVAVLSLAMGLHSEVLRLIGLPYHEVLDVVHEFLAYVEVTVADLLEVVGSSLHRTLLNKILNSLLWGESARQL